MATLGPVDLAIIGHDIAFTQYPNAEREVHIVPKRARRIEVRVVPPPPDLRRGNSLEFVLTHKWLGDKRGPAAQMRPIRIPLDLEGAALVPLPLPGEWTVQLHVKGPKAMDLGESDTILVTDEELEDMELEIHAAHYARHLPSRRKR